ncbi:MAG: ABC-type multidrug transport system, ATPase and permease component [Actinomycetia bacterium]|nr:ABC-type multidrug transport system, ATPase and permease component [Actinomycetes bacterium]
MAATVRPHRKWVVWGILAGLLWTAARVSIPSLTGFAIDDGIVPGKSSNALRWTVLILAVGVVQAAATGLRRYAAFRLALRVEADLRMRLAAHLQQLHFAFHDEAQTGQLMARANTDIQQVQQVVLLIPLTIASTLSMLAVIAILVSRSPGLAFFGLAALPFLNVAAARFTRRMYPVSLELQEELADLSSVVEESVTGIRVVKGFGAEGMQTGRLAGEADSVYDRSIASARLRAAFLPLIDLLPTLGLVGILWYGGHQVLRGQLTIGDIVAANFYVLMLIWPLRMLGMLLGQLPRSAAAAGRIHEVLATDPQIIDRPGARPLTDGPGEVRFEGVQFGYGEGRPVLNDFDLVVHGGEAVAIVGATASGKSTVARLIPRFYDVDAGHVRIDGTDVRDARVADVRRAVGTVFEDTFLFSDTVRNNIAFADPDAPMEAVVRAARLAGADEFLQELPDGYDTVVGEHGYSLSGGQRQRVAIARAVIAQPRVLILDDATSSVDPTKEHEIRGALREVMEGRTTIIIAHRPATIALADRVVLIDNGRAVASGTHDELLATNERYREVLARAEAGDAAFDDAPTPLRGAP